MGWQNSQILPKYPFFGFFGGIGGKKNRNSAKKCQNDQILSKYSFFGFFCGLYGVKKIPKVPKNAKMAKFCQNSHFLGGIGGKKKLKFFSIESWNPNAKKNYKIIMELKNYSTTIDKII